MLVVFMAGLMGREREGGKRVWREDWGQEATLVMREAEGKRVGLARGARGRETRNGDERDK